MSLVQDPSTGTAANIKGPSTAPTTTDAAMVVSISPNCTVTTSATAPTDRVASGTITALNANVPISAAGIGDVGVTITGTWSATLTFQGTIDASNWFTVQAMPLPVTQTSTTSSSTTTNGQFTVPLAGLNQFRVTATAFSSGTVTVTLEGNESAATTTGIHTVQQGTAANLQATATQGPAASLSGAWPTEITDGTHGPAAVKAASTGAAAADPSLVVALSPNSPLPTGANVVGAVTQSGGPWTVSGTVTVTQTTPSNLQGEVAGLAAAGSAPVGNPVQIGGSDGTNIRTLLTDTSGRQEVVGAAASGAAVAGNPVLIAGSDGTDARSISTDASGHPVIVGDGTAGSPAGGVVSVQGVVGGTALPVSGTVTASGTVTSNQGTANTVANAWPTEITDGTHGPAAVKAASTAAAAADPSLVVALSPNSPLPTGANVVGAVTQSGAWTTTVTQATPANLQAEVGGLAAAGSVPVGNPVQIGGSDGTDIRTLATDASGHPVIVGDGTAGSPAGGVVSVQGVAGGTAIPVSGTVTASNPSVGSTGTTTPTSATLVGGTDGTNLVAIKIKDASTAAVAADPSLVVAISPNSPLPTGANVVGAVTQSGTWSATVTQATPSNLQAEVGGLAAAGAAPVGNPVQIGGSDGTDIRTLLTDASGRQVVVGAAASGAALAGNPVLIAGSDGTDTRSLTTDASGHPVIVGDGTAGSPAGGVVSVQGVAGGTALPVSFSGTTTVVGDAASGSPVAGNPVLIGGSDGTDARTISTDASGHPVIVGDGTAGSPAGGVVSVQGVVGGQSLPVSGSVTASGTVTSNQGTANTVANAWPTEITDGTHGPAAVKAASTAAAAADPSLVIALSPNSPLPTGANVVGAVTQSGAWTATVTQATPANLQAEVGGLGAAGAALVGNPVQIGGSDGTDTRTLLTDSTGRQIMVGAAADGAAFVGNPVLIGGQDGTDAQALLTDTLGRLVTAGAGTAGTPAGGVFSVQGVSGGQVIPISGTTTANQGTPNTLANAWPVEITDGTHGPVAIKAASTAAVAVDVSAVVALSPNSPLYDNFGNPIAVKNRVQMPSTQGVTPISGLDVGVLNRLIRVGEVGSVRTTSETQLWHDAFEGSTVNAFWTQSTTTQTIAQATGVLTLNNSGITTVNTDSIITSQRQFPKYPKVALHARYKANISANVAANHTLVEFGFGAPAGVTAVISNGCFFRMTAAGNLVGVTSYNGTENVSATLLAQGSITTTSYYRYDIFVEDQFARFIVTDANDIPVVDFQLQIPLTAPNIWAVSHLPTFARVYVDATGGGTVVKLLLSGHDVQLMDILTNKPWNVQLASQMRNASINPTTYAQTASSMTAAPATETPSNTVGGYNALGGDFATALTVASENPLSVFGFQIPSPYTFYLTMMQWSVPFVSTTIGVTGVPVLEWLIIANCASGDIATGGGQKFPVGLNMVYTGATQAAGSLLTIGGNLVWNPDVPVPCLPGTFLHIAYKVFITSAAATPGVTRGSVYVDGYFE